MIIQEKKIKKEADRLVQLAIEFLEGVNFNPKLPQISDKDDLPCNHEELFINDDKKRNKDCTFNN